MNQRSGTHSNLGKVLWRGREEEKLSFCSEHRDPSPKASFFSRTRSYGGGFVTASVCSVCIATGRYPKFTSAIAKSHSKMGRTVCWPGNTSTLLEGEKGGVTMKAKETSACRLSNS